MKLPETPDHVGDDEIVLRLLLSKRWVKLLPEGACILKPEAVDPVVSRRNEAGEKEVLGLSITRKLSLDDQQIKYLAEETIILRKQSNPERTFEFVGTAAFKAVEVRSMGLDIEKEELCLSHHGNIINWPTPIMDDDANGVRGKINELKAELVSRANLSITPR